MLIRCLDGSAGNDLVAAGNEIESSFTNHTRCVGNLVLVSAFRAIRVHAEDLTPRSW